MNLSKAKRLCCLITLPLIMLAACDGTSVLDDKELDVLARYDLSFPNQRLGRCVASLLQRRDIQSLDEIKEVSCSADGHFIVNYSGDILNDENRNEQGELLSAVIDTRGLEKLKNLEVLNLSENLIRSIDLTDFQNLRRLDLSSNLIENLDLRNNPKLEYLKISGNPISSINIRGLSALEYLDVAGGVSIFDNERVRSMNHPELEGVNFDNFDGKVSLIGVDDLTSLSELKIERRPQTIENFSSLPALVSVNLSYSDYSFLDFSENQYLKEVSAGGNTLNGIELSSSAVLDRLSISDSNLDTIENLLRRAKSLSIIGSRINDTGHLDLTNPDNIVESLGISSSGIKSIEIREQIHLKHLSLGNNLLSSIDISGAPNLVGLGIDRNRLITHLAPMPNYAGAHHALQGLSASDNAFASLDVSQLPNLTGLSLDRNTAIAEIDLTANSKLARLDARLLENLEKVNFPDLSALVMVNLAKGKLTSLDVTTLPQLQFLNLDGNDLTELDISSNAQLRELRLRSNNLSLLDVTTQINSETGTFLGLCRNDSFSAGGVDMLAKAFELVSLPAHLSDTGSDECGLVSSAVSSAQ